MVLKGHKASPNQLIGLSIGWKNKHMENNPNWKGDNIKYKSLHAWIRRNKPKIELCENCNKNKSYDLANISGKYKRDINDFKWLCRRCHMFGDGRMLNMIKINKLRIKTPEQKRLRMRRYDIINRNRFREYHRNYNKIWYQKNKLRILSMKNKITNLKKDMENI